MQFPRVKVKEVKFNFTIYFKQTKNTTMKYYILKLKNLIRYFSVGDVAQLVVASSLMLKSIGFDPG